MSSEIHYYQALVGAKHAGKNLFHTQWPSHACFALRIIKESGEIVGQYDFAQGEAPVEKCVPVDEVLAWVLRPYEDYGKNKS